MVHVQSSPAVRLAAAEAVLVGVLGAGLGLVGAAPDEKAESAPSDQGAALLGARRHG